MGSLHIFHINLLIYSVLINVIVNLSYEQVRQLVTKKKYNKHIRKYNKFKELGYLSGAGLLVLSSIELLRKEPRL
jgi:hypothetical protein